ncbi:putative AMP-dependent synthetase/ligase, Condensation domain, phosphopantetheine binding ACP [Septoria linicola]|nr:putative AMP-dependent synthetase/ligase, Condensation domain, phosphopantetheine binding ACP [Septoria linicola]
MGDYESSSVATSSAPARRQAASAFWTKQFANLEAEQFPKLPSMTYLARPGQSVEHNIEGLGWDSSAFKPSVFIRLAWAILQSRYTNNLDILFGAAAGVNGTAFPNRIQLSRSATISDTLRDLQVQGEQMAIHSNVGWDMIQDASKEAEAACDYKTLLVLTSAEANMEQQRERRRKSLVDLCALTLECTVSTSGLWIRFVHDPAVLSSEQVERMSSQLGHVLRQILMQPQSTVSEISIACEEDLQDIWSWNKTITKAIDIPLTATLAKIVTNYPHSLAVEAWDGFFTYQQLDELSTRLAFHLAERGVGADAVVPLHFEKSRWMSVAIVAVMKAGATSMLLNANHPAAYLRSLTGRVQASALMCSANTISQATLLVDCAVVALDEDFFASLNIEPVEPLPSCQSSDRLCLIPNGTRSLTALTHKNFATALVHQTQLFGIIARSRIYDLDSYSSELTWLNQLLALSNGACLCVPSDEERKGDLADSLSKFRATTLITTAASAQNIDLSQAIDLETLVVSGEVTPKLELPPHVKLVSVYGMAECSIVATYATERQVLDEERCVGKGLATNTWVVSTSDPDELCGVGEVGELWLESPLVGEAYTDRGKEKVAFIDRAKFLAQGGPDVVGRQGRLYRTGDLVRYLPNGTIVFAGHQSDCIKRIRGHRVDLDEVEEQMRRLLGSKVDDVVAEVISAQGQPAPVLAAFIMPAGDNSDSAAIGRTTAQIAEELAAKLKQSLPSHMVPIVFLPLRAVPRTATGAINRKKLRENAERKSQDPENRTAEHAIRPAQAMTVLEVQLQQLWAQVLSIKDRTSITANSDWFTLGGDEAAAMRLVAAAQNWGLAVAVADVLARPRLADMAESVKHFHRASIVAPEGMNQPWSEMRRGTFQSSFASLTSSFRDSAAAPPTPHNSMDRRRSSILVNGKEELSATPMALMQATAKQQRLLQGSSDRKFTGMEYYAFDLSPELDQAKVLDACRKLVQHFDVLRTVFVQIEDNIYLTFLPNVDVPIEVHQVTSTLEESSKFVVQKDSTLPVVLGRSLLRIYVLHQASKHMRIILRTSQAVTDTTSMALLSSALSEALSGDDLPSAPSFLDYLRHTSTLTSSQSYWRNLLLGAPMTFIPKSPSSPSQPSAIISVSTTLPLPSISSYTPSTIFTAACALLLSRLSRSTREVVFARHATGRSALPTHLQDVVGTCENLVPVRVRLEPRTSIMGQVAEQYMAGLQHEHVDFESVANDNALTVLGDGNGKDGSNNNSGVGVDFGLVTSFLPQQQQITGDDGERGEVAIKFLGRGEGVPRSNAVWVQGKAMMYGRVGVEIRTKSSVQSRKKLDGMLGMLEEALAELGREGRGKRGVE